jgi:hypothetical protein
MGILSRSWDGRPVSDAGEAVAPEYVKRDRYEGINENLSRLLHPCDGCFSDR